jgi:hypothetical protein
LVAAPSTGEQVDPVVRPSDFPKFLDETQGFDKVAFVKLLNEEKVYHRYYTSNSIRSLL